MDTAPASPVNMPPPPPGTTSTTTTSNAMPLEHSTLAQMSFGPATQKTVTTVTTTTVVQLPPLIVKPPKDLFDRDPKQYPLAFSPTPKSIRKFCFDVNGNPTTFQEAEDPDETLRRYHQIQAKIRKSKGTIRQEEKQDYQTPVRGTKQGTHMGQRIHSVRASSAPKRTATPPSLAEAAELASLYRRTKKPRSQLHRTDSEAAEFPSLNQRAASGAFSGLANVLPVTPDTEIANPRMPGAPRVEYERRRGSPTRPSLSRLQQLQNEDVQDESDHGSSRGATRDAGPQLEPPLYGRSTSSTHISDETMQEGSASTSDTTTASAADVQVEGNVAPSDFRRPHLPNIVTSSQQDASLPSPSLSPITAAANLASRSHNAFDASFAEHHPDHLSTVSAMELDNDTQTQSAKSFESQESLQLSSSRSHQSKSQSQKSQAAGPTVMDIPTMIEAFDGMPDEMQRYVIYQFLRRCSKPTLQVVANVVNPALKCDPLNVLPTEIGQMIVRLLDAQSLCRAAQVSKVWRKLINSDERAWKDLLDRDEFVLPSDEIARAVREGWGWQHPGEDGYEEDLRTQIRTTPEATAMERSDMDMSDDEDSTSVTASKARRKTSLKYNKKKRRTTTLAAATGLASGKIATPSTTAPWHRLLASAQGPSAFANAATHAVPHPNVGLPGLKSMHLFKSLYQRHYLIRKSWMQESSEPQHLAFRAHHRHVVTCLLFDSDKILTGSDDTKINVYDTKTGALRNRLEGHEGGVWALQYHGDTLVSGSTDRSVRVWDIKTGRCLQVFQGHTSTVRCLVILQPVQIGVEDDGTPITMPKEPLIITGSRDSTLRVWKLPKPGDRQIFQAGPPANDRDNPYFLRTLSGHHNSVRAIAAHGDTLISGSYDCTVRVWKISTGDLVHRLQGHGQKVYSVVLDHARNRCISGSMDNLVKVWDLQTGTCLFNLEGHTSLVGLLDLSHDRLVSAAADSTLRIWDPENGACKATLSAHTGAITCFQHDGQKVISGSDRTLKMWNVKNGECVRDLLTDLSGVWQVRFDERRCVAAVQRNALTYIEVLDFGAARDGVPEERRGRRIVVDSRGVEADDVQLATGVDTDAVVA